MSVCRSCGREVKWVLLDTGKRMPLDPSPASDGSVYVIGQRAHVLAGGAAAHTARAEPARVFRSHFQSCPHAEAHRRRVTSRRTNL